MNATTPTPAADPFAAYADAMSRYEAARVASDAAFYALTAAREVSEAADAALDAARDASDAACDAALAAAAVL